MDLLSIGDATIDVFMLPTESEGLCRLDTKECLIAFPYGQKIPVKSLEFTIGGNAANNAVGVKRLGIDSGILLTLGDDGVGGMIINQLKKEGVDVTYVIQQPATTSNYSTIINYQGERTIFSYHAPRSYEFPVALPKVNWVYLTSMGEAFRPFYNHLVEWLLKNPDTKLVFNPGTWQVKGSVEAIAPILKLTHMIYVNREEAEKITNFGESIGREKELLTKLHEMGPKICIITDGGNGAYAYNSQVFLKCGILPVDPYERTGAGDSFGSACLSAVVKGKTLDEALVWGACNSASVIGYTGAQKGLLKIDEIDVWLERAKSSGVKVEQF